MIEVQVFGSSTEGNSYLLKEDNSSLMLDAGVALKKMRGVKWDQVAGCLLSHEHGDHSKYVRHLIDQRGLDIYSSNGTLASLKLPQHRVHSLKHLKKYRVEGWTIVPFDVIHDANEPFGYFIISPKGARIFFATDTAALPYYFPGVEIYMIECNYAIDILIQNMRNDEIDNTLGSRIIKTHFEFSKLQRFLSSADKSRLKEIYLLHLSNNNSDQELFKTEIEKLTGVPVYIAEG